MKLSRRSALQLLAASGLSPAFVNAAGAEQKFRIGACDWSIKQRQHIDAFKVGKEIGLEGLQVSFSRPGSDFDLREKKVREQYYRQVDTTGIEIASLAMGILNQDPLATNPASIGWVSDAIDTIAKMKKEQPDKAPQVCLLAFFGKADMNGKPDQMEAVVNKLKTVAKKAEDSGVILGIESLLSADDHLKVIDGVGSKAIQVYYDTANSNKAGYDIYEEVVQLGAERICEVHCKENKALLGEGKIDFPKFRKSLEKAGYSDWLIIEGALPKGAAVVDSYTKNVAALRGVFS